MLASLLLFFGLLLWPVGLGERHDQPVQTVVGAHPLYDQFVPSDTKLGLQLAELLQPLLGGPCGEHVLLFSRHLILLLLLAFWNNIGALEGICTRLPQSFKGV